MAKELLRSGIDFTLDETILKKRLHCEMDDEPFIHALQLLEVIRPLIAPSFAIREIPVDKVKENGVYVGENFLRSKIVAQKIQGQASVFAYVATSGRSLGDYIANVEDNWEQYLLDQIAYLAYLRAMEALSLTVENELGIENHIRLCPGSVIDWSVSDVRIIFALLDGLHQKLRVDVLKSGMIIPLKSTSGIFYATDRAFSSCSICPRTHCENRQANFDEELHNQMVNL